MDSKLGRTILNSNPPNPGGATFRKYGSAPVDYVNRFYIPPECSDNLKIALISLNELFDKIEQAELEFEDYGDQLIQKICELGIVISSEDVRVVNLKRRNEVDLVPQGRIREDGRLSCKSSHPRVLRSDPRSYTSMKKVIEEERE